MSPALCDSRWRSLACATVAVTSSVGLMVAGTGPALAYVVRPGDTTSQIAADHHTTVRRLVVLNHLPAGGSRLHVGQHLRLHGPARHRHRPSHHHRHHHRHRVHFSQHPSRRQVRHLVTKIAHAHHADRALALAVAWQESGWQQDVLSSDRAIGVMQVLASTGRWVSGFAGRRLHVWHTHDNIQAGVLLLRWLHHEARRPRHRIGAYYQGLASVRRHGLYPTTRRYVRDVEALRDRIRRGHYPQ